MKIFTYGCQMNYYDSQRIAKYFKSKAKQPAHRSEQACLIIFNMCAVRQGAVDKVFNKIKNIQGVALKKNKKIKIIATGCVLPSDRKKLKKLGVEFKKFKFLKTEKFRCDTRGFVPIMRGCNNFCSYCAVPYTRGREQSRSVEKIIQEVKKIINKGIKQITLLGQNVNSYSYKDCDFADLLKKINNLPGDFKIKFLTNHPKDMSDKLIKTIAQCSKVVQEIHLPAQAGSNKILKAMNRNYTREYYLKLVKKIKKAMPQAKLSTDIIVGFPKETKKDFEQTVDLLQRVDFDKAYIAQYSSRPGTAAARLVDNVSPKEKSRRHHRLLGLVKKD